MGAGMSGIMDAFFLSQYGFAVSIYAKGPDPRIPAASGKQHSSTMGGELGRFISRFEGEHYLGDSPMYPDMKGAFQRHVSDGGWLGKFQHELNEFDLHWLKKRQAACDDTACMKETERWYVESNKTSMELWQEIIFQFPHLFEKADLLNTGILRLYDTDTLFAWAVARHKKEYILERSLSPNMIAEKYPYFADAAECGYIAGGLEAPGFSFNVHAFIKNVICYLEAHHVHFYWKQTVNHIKFSPEGLVQGLVLDDTSIITGHYYSLNPGAYANESLFAGTPAAGKLAGVAGRWLIVPSPKNFKRPVKIHGDARVEDGKKFPVVDINLTHYKDKNGKEWLAVGGGYAYLGKPPFRFDNPAFDLIDAENERTVKRFLGPTFLDAQQLGVIKKSNATCVRSFTYNDRPVMDMIPAENGGILRINAGTNTGTTTIAPFTALETVKAFWGLH